MTNAKNKLKRIISAILSVTIILAALPLITAVAVTSPSVDFVADPSTAMSYKDMLGTSADGNRYAGRVWVDKSVFTDASVKLDKDINGADITVTNDSDFMVVYSALGSSTSVTTEKSSAAKLDVVLVLDNSSSMAENNKMPNVIKEANNLLSELVSSNVDARIGIVAYKGTAQTVVDLGKYSSLTLSANSYGVITAKDGNKTLGSSNGYYSGSSGTNTQSGINEGMQLLIDNVDKTRIPVVVVLTDGVANIADTGAWYDLDSRDSSTNRVGSITSGVVLSTILNGSYMKSAVENAYGRNTMVYGISVGLGNTSDAYVVMDPANYFKTDSSYELGKNAYSWYNEWKSGTGTIAKSERVSRTNWTWEFDQLAANDTNKVTKQQVIDNINFIDKHFKVESGDASLGDAFNEILETITTPAFNPITDTIIQGDTTSEVPLTFVDFIGEYMEVKDVKLVTLFGKQYSVAAGATTENFEVSGDTVKRTAVTKYIVGSNDTVTHPVFGAIFNVSKDIRIELTDVSVGKYVNGAFVKSGVSEQTLRVYIKSEALPAIVDKIKVDVNGKITFTEVTAEPVRVYYTVGVSDDITSGGEVDLALVSPEYIAANTKNGKVQFYSNRFGEVNTADKGVVANGDAHASFTPSVENRYYYHQNTFAVFSNVTGANGNPLTIDPETYGVEHGDNYNYTYLTADDFYNWENGQLVYDSTITDDKVLYTYNEYYRPVFDKDGNPTGEGELVYLIVDTTWGELKGSLTATKNIRFDQNVNNWIFEYAKDDMSAMTLDELAIYIEGLGTNYDLSMVRPRLAKGSKRVTRLHHMIVEKTENVTGTAANSYAPTYNEDTDHVGSIVVWLGNNGSFGTVAEVGIEISKQVTAVAEGDATGEFQFTVTSSAAADKGKTATARFFDADGNLKTAPNTVTFDSDGKLTVILKDGEKVQIIDLVGGATYTVTENDHALYKPQVKSFNLVPQVGAMATAAFVNSPKQFGNITINKKVTHDFGPQYVVPDIDFTIQLTFKDADGKLMANVSGIKAKITNTLTNVTNDVTVSTNADGKYITTLKHGEQLEIFGLEAGTTITGMELYNGNEYSANGSWYPGFSAPVKWHDGDNNADNQVTIHAGQTVTAGFINDYNAVLEKADVKIKLSGTKTFSGDWASVPNTRAFNVYLEKYVPATATTAAHWDRIATDTVSKADPTYDFTEAVKNALDGAAAGTYLFQIYEENHGTTVGGVTFDGTIHTFGVTVAEVDMTDGKLEITDVFSYHSDQSFSKNLDDDYVVTPDLVNIYSTNQVSATFDVHKNLTNLSMSDKVNVSGFAFTLTEAEVDVNGNWSKKTGGNVITSDATDLAGETAYTLTYTQDGTYYYILEEYIPANKIANMTYDTTKYRVKVVVTDDGNGNLTAETPVITKENGTPIAVPEFTNAYEPESVDVNFDVNKVLNGRPLADGEFTFKLEQVSVQRVDARVLASAKTVTNKADGTVDFGTLTFTKVGNYYFEISEVEGDLAGVTYDSKTFHISVVVTDNLATGKLEAEITVYDNVGEGMEFVNTYEAKTTDFTIHVGKDFVGLDADGNEIGNIALNGGEFTFTLEEVGGDEAVRYATNTARGEVRFDELHYTKAGTYTYKVYENISTVDNGITYDTRIYTLIVVVTDKDQNGKYTGKLKAQIDINNITEATAGKVTHVEFVNYYEADTTVTLNGMKYVRGAELSDTYQFVLYNSADGETKGSEVATKQNDADGKFEFALSYDLADAGKTYYYIVEEKDPGKFNVDGIGGGIKNDTRYFTVAVSLEDNGDGTLGATVTMTRDNGHQYDVLAFVNTYYDIIEKEVYAQNNPLVNIDGKSVSVGEVIEYTITYTNGYNETMDVEIVDTIPNGTALVEGSADDGVVNGNQITWNISVPAGETKTVSFKVTVNAGGADITNQATVKDEYNTYKTNETKNYTYEKSATANDVEIGDEVGYSVQYTNKTNDTVNVVITDTLDAGLTYIDGTATNGGVYSNGVITWTVNNVAPGATVTVSFDAIVNANAGDEINNTVVIKENDVEIKTNTVTVKVLKPELKLEKTQVDGKGNKVTEKVTAEVGDKFTYYITVSNLGDGVANKVTIKDIVPAGLIILEDTVSNLGTVSNGVIIWNIDEIEAGESVTVSFQVEIPTVTEDTVFENTATVAFDKDGDDEPDEEEPTNTVEVEVKNPDIPDTGDTSMALWVMFLMLSGAGFVMTLFYGKRKEQE